MINSIKITIESTSGLASMARFCIRVQQQSIRLHNQEARAKAATTLLIAHPYTMIHQQHGRTAANFSEYKSVMRLHGLHQCIAALICWHWYHAWPYWPDTLVDMSHQALCLMPSRILCSAGHTSQFTVLETQGSTELHLVSTRQCFNGLPVSLICQAPSVWKPWWCHCCMTGQSLSA